MVWTWCERKQPLQTPPCKEVKLSCHKEGQLDSRWTGEGMGLSLNEMWRDPQDRVAGRKRSVSRI